MKIFLTNLPAFYKINLFNRIAEKVDILVIFTGRDADIRNNDFVKGEVLFRCVFLKGNEIQRAIQFIKILRRNHYSELIVGGWDNLSSWLGAFVSPVKKNSVVIESSILESQVKSVKGIVKRIFSRRMSRAYCSGISQIELIKSIGFKGDIIKTRGVGIFNYIEQPQYEARSIVKRFLYVGRLATEKNLAFLIERFNTHPELDLYIIGFGPLETELIRMSKGNIHFIGAVNNKNLMNYYSNSDVFVLPSLSEPWGLVVEEALNNGLPVMVSNRVGCACEIVNKNNGVVFDLTTEDFEEKLKIITDLQIYNKMRYYISKINYEEIEKYQVNCYIN